MADELSLATLGRSALDFLRTPYRPPHAEDRTPQARPVRQTPLDAFVQNVAVSLATLPERAFESANTFYDTGYYDPAPIMEAAAFPLTGGIPRDAGGGRFCRWQADRRWSPAADGSGEPHAASRSNGDAAWH